MTFCSQRFLFSGQTLSNSSFFDPFVVSFQPFFPCRQSTFQKFIFRNKANSTSLFLLNHVGLFAVVAPRLAASIPLDVQSEAEGTAQKLGSAPPRLPDSTGARVSLASNDLAALSAGENLLGRSSAGWRPDRAMLRSGGGFAEATARSGCWCVWRGWTRM